MATTAATTRPASPSSRTATARWLIAPPSHPPFTSPSTSSQSAAIVACSLRDSPCPSPSQPASPFWLWRRHRPPPPPPRAVRARFGLVRQLRRIERRDAQGGQAAPRAAAGGDTPLPPPHPHPHPLLGMARSSPRVAARPLHPFAPGLCRRRRRRRLLRGPQVLSPLMPGLFCSSSRCAAPRASTRRAPRRGAAARWRRRTGTTSCGTTTASTRS